MGQRATFFPVDLVTKSMVYWKGAFDVASGEERSGGGGRELVICPFFLTCGQRGQGALHPGCWDYVP